MQSNQHEPSIPYQEGIRVDEVVHIKRECNDVYRIWHDLQHLPKIMRHLKSVKPLVENRSHWVAEGLASQTVEWDAEIINDVPGELIGWRSLPSSAVATAGSVHFTPTADGTTELKVELQYDPPGGAVGKGIALLFRKSVVDDIREDLTRFRDTLEAVVPRSFAEEQKG